MGQWDEVDPQDTIGGSSGGSSGFSGGSGNSGGFLSGMFSGNNGGLLDALNGDGFFNGQQTGNAFSGGGGGGSGLSGVSSTSGTSPTNPGGFWSFLFGGNNGGLLDGLNGDGYFNGQYTGNVVGGTFGDPPPPTYEQVVHGVIDDLPPGVNVDEPTVRVMEHEVYNIDGNYIVITPLNRGPTREEVPHYDRVTDSRVVELTIEEAEAEGFADLDGNGDITTLDEVIGEIYVDDLTFPLDDESDDIIPDDIIIDDLTFPLDDGWGDLIPGNTVAQGPLPEQPGGVAIAAANQPAQGFWGFFGKQSSPGPVHQAPDVQSPAVAAGDDDQFHNQFHDLSDHFSFGF